MEVTDSSQEMILSLYPGTKDQTQVVRLAQQVLLHPPAHPEISLVTFFSFIPLRQNLSGLELVEPARLHVSLPANEPQRMSLPLPPQS